MKNIHILPTDKPSKIKSKEGIFDYSPAMMFIKEKDWIHQNIFITSDEEIKEGDWFLTPLNDLEYANKDWIITILKFTPKTDFKKIILTTDQDLIKDGVQPIPDEFLEWFVKNPSCELVNIRKVANGVKNHKLTYEYKIIIPKEEPKQESVINEKCFKCGNSQYKMGRPFCTDDFCNKDFYEKPKQETLEEAAELYKKLHEFRVKKEQIQRKEGFIDGAKWQQERSYSEEDMKLAFEAGHKKGFSGYPNTENWKELPFDEWFEQFKKK